METETPKQTSWDANSQFAPRADIQADPFADLPQVRTLMLPRAAKIAILLLMAVAAILYFVVKNMDFGGSQSTPEKAVKGFFRAVQNEDPGKMIQYLQFTSESLPEGKDKEALVEDWKKIFEQGLSPRIISFEIVNSKVEGDNAIIHFKVAYGSIEGSDDTDDQSDPQSVEQSYNLVKVDKKWYIDFFRQ